MTEAQYQDEIKRLEAETKRLRDERRALQSLAYDIKTHCPESESRHASEHDWYVVRADESAVFGGDLVRNAEFACPCGATMSVCSGQSKVGG